MKMNIVFVVALGILAAGNAVISIGVLRSPAYDSRQKSIQLGLLWLAPILGAVVVWSFLRQLKSRPLTADLASHAGGSVDGIRITSTCTMTLPI